LFDLCPPDYRVYDVLRRYPVVLARFAAGHVTAAQEAAKHGIATARAELRDAVPPEAVDAAVAAYEREAHRLIGIARAVELVGEALRGTRFNRKL
jgi:ABC-type nitrate/sulfonate/bicarbonate transport system substrate-binding protein